MTQQKLHGLAMNLLAIREHGHFELQQKLQRHCSDLLMIDKVLDELEKNDCLSEQRFVEAYVRFRKNRGYGPNLIRQKLLMRKVDKTLISQVLANEQDWEACANQALEKKYGDSVAKDYLEKAKRKRYLQQRGFLIETLSAIIE